MSRAREVSKVISTVQLVEDSIDNIDLSSSINTASAAAVAYLIDGAPAALNTLNELAAALNDNESFATTVTNELSSKLSISSASATYLPQTTASATYQTLTANNNSYRNKLINGDFSIWQRGTSFTEGTLSQSAAASYCSDRWYGYRTNGGPGFSISRQLSGLTGFLYCARVQRPATNSKVDPCIIAQSIETVNFLPLAGQTVTVSFYARSGANFTAANNALLLNIITGTGTDESAYNSQTFPSNGNYSNPVTALQQTFNITTTWTRYTATFTIQSTATESTIRFYYNPVGSSAPANDFFEITGVQLELGSVATPYESILFGDELILCQRYYETGTFGNNVLTGSYVQNVYTGSTPGFATTHISFKVTKRVTPHTIPTLTISGMWVSPGSFGVTASTNHTFLPVDASPDNFKFITNRVVGNSTPTVSGMYHWESSPWSWNVSAEL